jgi:hypothetical protein
MGVSFCLDYGKKITKTPKKITKTPIVINPRKLFFGLLAIMGVLLIVEYLHSAAQFTSL